MLIKVYFYLHVSRLFPNRTFIVGLDQDMTMYIIMTLNSPFTQVKDIRSEIALLRL